MRALSEARPGGLTVAWHAIRPHTLSLSLAPVLIGALLGWMEGGGVRLDIVLAAALSAMCMQMGANLHNDVADALNGTDGPHRPGPARVTQLGWATAASLRWATAGLVVLAMLAGAYLIAIGGWPLLVLGLLALLAAWAYSGGPRPIARGPFGELVVLVFFGLIAVGAVAWLHTGTLSLAAVLLGLVLGLPAAAVLMINNLRDLSSDRAAGRRTLAIRLGPRRARLLIGGLVLGGAPVLLAVAALGLPWTGALLGLAAWLPLRRLPTLIAGASTGLDYQRALQQTARFQWHLSLLIFIGVALAQYLLSD